MKRILFGLNINEIIFDNLVQDLTTNAKNRESSYLCAVNSHMTVLAQKDDNLKEAINNAKWAVTDGVPVSWAFSFIHKTKQERLAGMDLTPALLEIANKNRLTVSVIGNTTKNLNLFEEKMGDCFPNAKIGALLSPPYRELTQQEQNSYTTQIKNSNTNILLVSLGCPKQEKWMFNNYKKTNAVCLGIGNAINTFIGEEKRPSDWVQKIGMEWFFRLVQNPKRLFKRYLVTNAKFCVLVLSNVVKK